MKTIIIILLLINTSIISQTTNWEENQLDGRDYPYYVGGFSKLSIEFADIDADGDNDCFIGTKNGRIAYLENVGDLLSPSWKLITKKYLDIELMTLDRLKVRLIDIDGDNDLDLFIGGGSATPLLHYRNIGTEYNPEWEIVPDFLSDIEAGSNLKFCYPAFVDIDNDEDYDLIYGNYYGTDILYENIGDKFNYNFINRGSEYFGLIYYHNCHNIEFHDIDGDSDYDALIGTHYYLLLMKNIGTPDSAIWQSDTSNYLGINRYNCGTYYSPAFTDLYNSDFSNLYVGTENGSIWCYDSVTSNWAKNNSFFFDKGYQTNPEFADLNGDGVQELIIPSYNYPNDTSFVQVYSNIGNADSIVWELSIDNILVDFPYPINRVTFADVDSDNDLDLIAGFKDFNLDILLYLNTGDMYSPNFSDGYEVIATFQEDQLIDFYPLLIDYDNDSDLDLIVSAQEGTTNSWDLVGFFNNTGDSSSYCWEHSHTKRLGRGAITCLDDDGDGDLDLLFSFFNKVSVVYNIGNIYEPFFEYMHYYRIEIADQYISGLALSDLNNNGENDLIIGTYFGGLYRYDNMGIIQSVAHRNQEDILLFPNPTGNQATISGLNTDINNYELSIYNNNGKFINRRTIVNNMPISFLEYTSGMYIYKIFQNNIIIKTGKILIMK